VALTETAIPATPVIALGRPNQILFVTNRNGLNKIYVINEDGTQERAVIPGGAAQLGPSWSPDRTQIAFASGGNPTEIFIFDIATNTITQVTSGPGNKRDPTWSPSGNQISYLRSESAGNGQKTNLHLINPDGTNDRVLVEDVGNLTGPATWSPDSRRLAFARDIGAQSANFEIHVINADGSNEVSLTSDGHSYSPDWSPDGRTIAYVNDRSGTFELYTMNADGSNAKKLLDEAMEQFNVDWSPDGTRLVFSGGEVMINFDLFIVNRDGTGLYKIIEQRSGNFGADW
jgi:Tol biopolymer transport system component